jgi:hypothetical protein
MPWGPSIFFFDDDGDGGDDDKGLVDEVAAQPIPEFFVV